MITNKVGTFLKSVFNSNTSQPIFRVEMTAEANAHFQSFIQRMGCDGAESATRLAILALDEQMAFIDAGGTLYASYPHRRNLAVYDPRKKPGLDLPQTTPRLKIKGNVITFPGATRTKTSEKARGRTFSLSISPEAELPFKKFITRTGQEHTVGAFRLALLCIDEQAAFIDGGGTLYAKYPGQNQLIKYDPRLEPGLTIPESPNTHPEGTGADVIPLPP